MWTRKRWFVGNNLDKYIREAFKSDEVPTVATHGHLYTYVIGPFKTKRCAQWAKNHQFTTLQTVDEMEAYVKKMMEPFTQKKCTICGKKACYN